MSKGIQLKLFLGYCLDGEFKSHVRSLGMDFENIQTQFPSLTVLEKEKKYLGLYLTDFPTLQTLKKKNQELIASLSAHFPKIHFVTKKVCIFPVVFLG